MDTTRWTRIEALFHELADWPAGPSRDAELAVLCQDDPALAAEVRALLENDSHFEADDEAADPHLGLRLGSYQITALVARGGMAAVYEAQRADDQFRHRVAVKIMDLRLSDPALVAQFRAERQILAALEHPAVTRLLDGGVTALGEPYLVMEYVDGQPIDRYCDERRLGVPERLRLFGEVCDAVAFAHRALVLHRDLKPSNILVTDDGRVKVVDFGTATLLQPDRLSTISAAPLTPAYASPEQLTGTPVGTASDQYSLGIVLYELLTGAGPFGDRPSLLAAIERALGGTTTTAPHTVVTDAAAADRRTSLGRLRRLLSKDLGTIVTKALAPEPAARYASVQHFADDLTRWADGAPIQARPPSIVYGATRFVQRHWIATGTAAALVASLAVATAVSAQQANIARTESAKARQLNQFLTDMLSSANPAISSASRASTVTVREVLDKASPLVSQSLGTSPELEAEMLRVIGATYNGLGAAATGEEHLRKAIERFTAQGDAAGAARSRLDLGRSLIGQGRDADAEATLRPALAVAAAQPDVFDARTRLTGVINLGIALTNQKVGHPEALALYRDLLADAEAAAAPSAAANAAHNLGLQLVLLGQLDDAERWLRDAQRRWEAVTIPAPDRFAVSRSLSELMRTMGNYPEAVRFGRAAVAGFAELLPPQHPYQPATKTTLGRALVLNGEVEEGERVLDEALALFQAIRPPGHPELTATQLGLGIAYRLTGRLADSERILREARAVLASTSMRSPVAAGVAGELGLTLRALGRSAEADKLLRESYDTFQSSLDPTHPYVVTARARLAGAQP